ncbi:GIY-YIG nuclease family protein [Thiopseudomonas denitrificans]|uniref:T5orf172 domain-containing protein n=1 Tax=Thiopseudomonas denitrificans TaxID=1501432 RepID=A0A4R6U0F7_9GAMM|nr:GIY-YIG nuclease family protein [Thiopseudomonas denitrificans]TDQ37849.1 T5orf172 domain-containing protein [Thiopseudomonas denitrificans]
MPKNFTAEDDELLAALGIEVEVKPQKALTPRQERIIAGFEEIQRFYEQHGRAPLHLESGDIFERLYAVRLERLRSLEECRELVEALDHQGLLTTTADSTPDLDALDDDALLAELGIEPAASELTTLKHVRSTAEKRAAEEIANRESCKDFERFQPLFKQIAADLGSGVRKTMPFGNDTSIEVGQWFVLDGQTAYVAEEGEEFDSPQGKKDARLRVIFSNKTEAALLRLSLVRALYKDESSRRITEPDAGPLFSGVEEDGDIESGTIYVLRSQSQHPFVAEHRELIHKIGVTGGKVATRIANAAHEATYLLAEVEVVATYKLVGINKHKMEALFHRIFAPAQLELTIEDRFGHPVKPREWFLVPLHVIDEAVQRIMDGTIAGATYDPASARLV